MTNEQMKEARELCAEAIPQAHLGRGVALAHLHYRIRSLLPAALDEIERLRWLKKKRYVVGPDPRRNGQFIVRDAFSTWPDCIVAEGATEDEAIDNALKLPS